MTLKINLKWIAAGQLIIGVILIAFSFSIDQPLHLATSSFSELPSILESLKATSPNSNQLLRAAQILEMQSDTLNALREAGEDVLATLKLFGLFMLFTGFVLLWQDRRKVISDKTT